MEPTPKPLAKRRPWTVGHVLIPLCGALCLLPGVSPAIGLVTGLAVALAFGNPYLDFTRKQTHRLLEVCVIGLGAGMNLAVVARVGLRGLGYTAVGVAFCLTVGLLLARWLKVPSGVGTLISVGTAICGGSAIAAVVPVIEPEEHEVSVALGTVFLLNAVALVLFPVFGHVFHLSQTRFGLWCALAIHDTSSVVGAAVAYGKQAVEVATTTKLARALWIVPVTIGFARIYKNRRKPGAPKPKRPWFIAGFVLAAALVSFVPALRTAGALVSAGAIKLLVLTLFLIGAGLTRSALRAVGVRPLAQGVLLWMIVGSVSLAVIGGGLLG